MLSQKYFNVESGLSGVEQVVLELCADTAPPEPASAVANDGAWPELVSCLLSSQVRYETATLATTQLRNAGLLHWDGTRDLAAYEASLVAHLTIPMVLDGRQVRYRFPSKGRQIAAAFQTIRRTSGTLAHFLRGGGSDCEARELLIKQVPGLGPKQASMFLRNVGLGRNLAVLDVHSLGFMEVVGLIRRAPRSLRMPEYYVLESILQQYARTVGHPIVQLDRAIWAVMKAARTDHQCL